MTHSAVSRPRRLRVLLEKVAKVNYHRIIREALIRSYLSRVASADAESLLITWQPLVLVCVKVAIVVLLSVRLHSYYPLLSGWLQKGVEFFRLHEIYNFEFPKKPFFDAVSRGLLLFVIGYYGLFFGYHQIQALCSSLAVDRKRRRVYYIHHFLVKKDLYVLAAPEMDLVVLKQNVLSRPLGIGTLVLRTRSGERVTARSVGKAAGVVRLISAFDKEGTEASDATGREKP